MGHPKRPQPVRLVIGIITCSTDLVKDAKTHLETAFGPIDIGSETIPFTHTTYYTAEFGSPLFRLWFSHERLISPEDIVLIKLKTNEIEMLLSLNGKRRVNLDPGYLSLSKLILATTKDAAHRIYLKNGIYGEVTLFYKDQSWVPFQWTYPDYKERVASEFFELVRKRYLKQLKGKS